MKREKPAFTVVELLAVIGIVALLVGMLIPALSVVKNAAKQTKQKAQFTTIELALTAFRNDYGDYPPSDWAPGGNYCGAQKLAEALLGWDLLGFHPDSAWRADGLDATGTFPIYDAAVLDKRKGPYLDLGTASAFRLRDIARNKNGAPVGTGTLDPDRFVICDVFGRTQVTLPNSKIVKAGAPILYYRANTSANNIRGIYNINDNDAIVAVKELADNTQHPFGSLYAPPARDDFIYGDANPAAPPIGYIQDPKITARPWPYRPDSFLLISAGPDGIYGTGDDIRNFGD